MYLEAMDAIVIFKNIISDSQFGLIKYIEEIYMKKKFKPFRKILNDDFGLCENNPIIIRTFLTTARSYKRNRKGTISNPGIWGMYEEAIMPKYVWVCEVYSSLNDSRAIGEIIIDATASPKIKNRLDSIILINYPFKVIVRAIDETFEDFSVNLNVSHNFKEGEWDLLNPYRFHGDEERVNE